MADVAPAQAPAKAAKKKAAPRPKKTVKAVSASKERSSVSLAVVKKAMAVFGYDVEKNKACAKIAVKSLVKKGTLVQLKGTGASGSFKMNKKAEAVEVKKPAAAKKVGSKSTKTATKNPKNVAKTYNCSNCRPKKVSKKYDCIEDDDESDIDDFIVDCGKCVPKKRAKKFSPYSDSQVREAQAIFAGIFDYNDDDFVAAKKAAPHYFV